MVKIRESLELTIDRLGPDGAGVASAAGGLEVLVRFTAPGDRVRARVFRRRGRRAEARLEEILDASPLRVAPRCRHFGECGGCRWQHVLYAAQLDAKHERVAAAFARHGVAVVRPIRAVEPAADTYGYRNKMEFSFGARRWLSAAEVESGLAQERDFALGLHAQGRYDRVLDLAECAIAPPLAARLMAAVRDEARAHGFTPWNVEQNRGDLRHLVFRSPRDLTARGGALVDLVVREDRPEIAVAFEARLRRDFPEVATFLVTVNEGVAQVAAGLPSRVVFGPGHLVETLGGLRFEIGPRSFFQTNTSQAERLCALARDFAAATAQETVLDLFCGVGTLALALAGAARHVIGVELDDDAVVRARRNAAANGVENTTFVAGDLAREPRAVLAPWFAPPHRPAVVVVDPPRAGLHARMVAALLEAAPARLVYVSCNPDTQARDLAALQARYAVEEAVPIDLFPNVEHVECVARLTAR